MESDPSSLQALIDALSIAVRRGVLLDDAALAPLAFSRQLEVDEVRAQSILRRGAQPQVRDALFAQGIAAALDVVHTAAVPELGMEERVCLPVRSDGDLLGYIWILDPRSDLSEDDFDQMRTTARDVGALLRARPRREVPDDVRLVAGLLSPDPGKRELAAAEARSGGRLLDEPVVLCLIASAEDSSEDALAAAQKAVRRLSLGHAIASTAPEGAVLVASLADPVLRVLPAGEVAVWVSSVAGPGVLVGQSAPTSTRALDEAMREAELALRTAGALPGEEAKAWPTLGADRLVAQLPPTALADVPEPLATFLKSEPSLAATLATFLDAGGDVKRVSEALSLHRSGVYYRLRRIEELTGLDLDRGEDRLLAHLAVRLRRAAPGWRSP